MAITSAKSLKHQFCMEELRQIGAHVIEFERIMFIVKYHTDQLKIEYMYHINQDNVYILERLKPYALMVHEFFRTEEEVVQAIKNDIEQFENARHSKNFDSFVSIDQDLTKIARLFEDLYLYYNIDIKDIDLLKDDVKTMVDAIMDIKNRSERVYHKTEPRNFR